jgi:hypothetical protein
MHFQFLAAVNFNQKSVRYSAAHPVRNAGHCESPSKYCFSSQILNLGSRGQWLTLNFEV